MYGAFDAFIERLGPQGALVLNHDDPYLRALTLLSAAHHTTLDPATCVAIEDSRWGLESARTAGLRTVAVTHYYDNAALADADLVIADISALNVSVLHGLCSPKSRQHGG